MQQPNEEFGGWFWTNLRIYTPWKAIAAVTACATLVVGCGREAALSNTLKPLHYLLGTPPKSTAPASVAALAAGSAQDVGELWGRQSERDLTAKERAHLARALDQLDRHIAGMRAKFAADRSKLAGLDAQAGVDRVTELQRRTATLVAQFHDAAAAVPATGDKSSDALDARRVLAKLFPAQPEQATSSNLSFGAKNADPKSVSTSAGITPAYGAPAPNDTPSALPTSPSADDLAQTADTKISAPVQALADQLSHDPVKIFAYVHDHVRYEPYAGVRKGPAQTLSEASGSDADQAALLVALLRASGIQSRFVRGVAELPAAKVANWLGIDTGAGQRVEAGPDILSSGGIATTQIRVNGALSRVRFDHVWVEAYLPAAAYRGVDEGLASKRWMALDPSIKEQQITSPTADPSDDLQARIQTKVQQYADQTQTLASGGLKLPSGADTRQLASDLFAASGDALAAKGVTSSADLSKVLGSATIVPFKSPYLPSSTPFKTVSVTSEARGLPASLWSQITIDVGGASANSVPAYEPERDADDGFTYSASTFDLAAKRITLGYAPATDDDAAIIDSYHGLINTPSYAAALIPVLRVDGQVVARGHRPVAVGYAQNFHISYRSPGFAPDVVDNPAIVGGLEALTLDLGTKSKNEVDARAAQLGVAARSATADNVMTDQRMGDLLALAGDTYFALNDQHNRVASDTFGVDARRAVSGAIVSTKLSTRLVAGFPIEADLTGMNIDVDEDVQAMTPLTGDAGSVHRYLSSSATTASISESFAFMLLMHSRALSTTDLLARAATAGIPTYQITSANLDAASAQLTQPPSVVSKIRQAVEDGATVIVPRDPITIHNWRGTGYVISDGDSMAYMISGGSSGGDWGPEIGPVGTFESEEHLLDWAGMALFFTEQIATALGVPAGFSACLDVIMQIVDTLFFPASGESMLIKGLELALPGGQLLFILQCVMAFNEIVQTIGSYHECGEALGNAAAYFVYGDTSD